MFVRASAGLALALSLAFAPLSAKAMMLFDFAWSGQVGVNGAIASDDGTLRASGTVGIDAAPGQSFTELDFALVDIFVSGDSIDPFRISSVGGSSFTGFIDASGAFAQFTLTVSPLFFDAAASTALGCASPLGCANARVVVDSNGDRFVTYPSAAEAATSFRMTAPAAAVPLPSTLPLVAAGIAAFGLLRRRARG